MASSGPWAGCAEESYQVIRPFGLPQFSGLYPTASVTVGADGALYGTTSRGGRSNTGTLFRLNPDGSGFTELHSFGDTSGDGTYPYSLVQGPDGALYSTTVSGGPTGLGTVFKLNLDGSGYQILHTFSGINGDGKQPYATVVIGADGALYGTTFSGGAGNAGTVFRLKLDGSDYAVLFSFPSTGGQAANPQTSLIVGTDERLYGTASSGGGTGSGAIFRLNSDGTGYSVLHSFTIASEGSHPSRLVQHSNGVLYGTTQVGASGGSGAVFRVNTDGAGYTTLYAFPASAGSPAYPMGGLVIGADAALYATTEGGGNGGYGTIFRISPDGSSFRVLRRFSGGDGAYPYASLAVGIDGILYGTTRSGGSSTAGTVFRLNQDGQAYLLLQSFGNTAGDGETPSASLVVGTDGALYGTTQRGGHTQGGTVFKVSLDGSAYNLLHSFDLSAGDGASPYASLVVGMDGALYGTTFSGGGSGAGTVFKLNQDGAGYCLLHRFILRDIGGEHPYGGLAVESDGVLYGTTSSGGVSTVGTVFKLNADGTGYSVLHSFSNLGGDGSNPYATLLVGVDGALYGTTVYGGASGSGTVFRLMPDGSSYSLLHSFNNSNGDGINPYGGLVAGTDGALYGVTTRGGISGLGTVFKINRDGSGYGLLHNFSYAGGDGYQPFATLMLGADWSLYGTTVSGGFGYGSVFKINQDGSSYTLLHSLYYNSDGGYAYGGLVAGPDSGLYGTTQSGGAVGIGTVFRIPGPVPKYNPVLTWPKPQDIVYGTTLSSAQLDATASFKGVPVAGSFAYNPPAGALLNAGQGQTLSVTFTPVDPASFNIANASVMINVSKATPLITWSNPPEIVYGTALGPAQLTAAAGVPGAFTYTPAAGTILSAGSGQVLSVSFVPNDTVNYNSASATVVINVLKATPVITWANPADIVYGTALGLTQFNAQANVPGTFSYTPAAGTILSAGSGQALSVSFVPNDTANYKNASAAVFINVLTASQATAKLASAVNATTIPADIKTALLASLQAAEAAFGRGNQTAGVNQLQAFQNKLQAQAGKKVDRTTAGNLTAQAQDIINAQAKP